MRAFKKSKTIAALFFIFVLVPTAWECSAQSWTGLSNMSNTRQDHTSTLLPDGRVLVAGGQNIGGFLNTAEIYDPVSDSWTPTSNTMGTPRAEHTATVLSDGRVLVTGGYSTGNTYVGMAEVYDPASDLWTSTGISPMGTARRHHTATRLLDGRVLVAGGETTGPNYLDTIEIFDPSRGTWDNGLQAMSAQRSDHTATLLDDGTVLMVGGWTLGSGYLDTAEIYTPGTDTWAGATAVAGAGAHGCGGGACTWAAAWAATCSQAAFCCAK